MLPKTAAMKTNNPDEVRYCCTHCGDDGFHMYFNLKKNVFHCFKCGIRGISKPKRTYTDEALKEMYDILTGEKSVVEAKKVLVLPSSFPVKMGSLAMRYMINRGISPVKVSAMGCMTSTADEFDNRIIIPVYNESGKVVFYQARALLKSMSPKYLNPIIPKRDAIFCSWGREFVPNLKHIFVVEGIFKALRFWEAGLNSIAIFGKEITREQITAIWQMCGRITIMLDPDALGFALKMKDIMYATRSFDDIRILAPHKAPDDMTREELLNFLKKGGYDEVLQ